MLLLCQEVTGMVLYFFGFGNLVFLRRCKCFDLVQPFQIWKKVKEFQKFKKVMKKKKKVSNFFNTEN